MARNKKIATIYPDMYSSYYFCRGDFKGVQFSFRRKNEVVCARVLEKLIACLQEISKDEAK